MDISSYITQKGSPQPMGATLKEGGINFALFSKHATAVTLFIYAENGHHPLMEVPLDPKINKTGSTWHVHILGLPERVEYNYQINGPNNPKQGLLYNPNVFLIDPYAKSLNSTSHWKASYPKSLRGRLIKEEPFNWEGTSLPRIPMKELIIYEMHVRGFTKHPSSNVAHPGTFLGVSEKIPYLKSLGVNAIELMPIHEFNENENYHRHPITKEPLVNFWGYSPVNFLALMNRYGSCSDWGVTLREFKTMVKAFHKENMEVYIDVVFNHSAEGNEKGAYYSLKGIDSAIYYMIDSDGQFMNFSGCGNTLNCNHPIVSQFIVDTLRYWVTELHIDGFRFDLASVFSRNQHGVPLPHPPILDMIAKDPVLSNVKLIAEAWDAGGLYQVGSFPSSIWAEWNGKYRDAIRRFIKGTEGATGEFATRIAGSEDLYVHDRKPYHSVNFIVCHDGFCLKDLVSYDRKHNEDNAEANNDGSNDNISWNCGIEGPTTDPKILKLREKQMKNFHFALMISIGTPMIFMGDEYGHTKNGNNNTYCHDNELNYFLWDELQHNQPWFRFYILMIAFRKKHAFFHREEFLTPDDIQWHSAQSLSVDWSSTQQFIAFTIKTSDPQFYIAFNPSTSSVTIEIPPLPEGRVWKKVVDTDLPSPEDYHEDIASAQVVTNSYQLQEFSALLLQASPINSSKET